VTFPCCTGVGWRGWKREVGCPNVAANIGDGEVGVREVTRGDPAFTAGVGIRESVSPKFSDN
jgi:hypothetical protein